MILDFTVNDAELGKELEELLGMPSPGVSIPADTNKVSDKGLFFVVFSQIKVKLNCVDLFKKYTNLDDYRLPTFCTLFVV